MSDLWRRLLAGGLAIGLALASLAAEPEDELKAAVVLSFLRYTDWPSSSAGNSALSVGVVGRPALLEALHRVLDNKSVGERPIKVVELHSSWDPHCCQIIYLALNKAPATKQALATAQNSNALTIGESVDFLELGGSVNLLIIDGHMSFEVSRDALDHAGMTISSKLLRFGQVRNVRGKAHE